MCFGTHLAKCCDTKGAELTILSDDMNVKTTAKGTAEVDDQPGMEEGRVDSSWLGSSSKLDQLTVLWYFPVCHKTTFLAEPTQLCL